MTGPFLPLHITPNMIDLYLVSMMLVVLFGFVVWLGLTYGDTDRAPDDEEVDV